MSEQRIQGTRFSDGGERRSAADIEREFEQRREARTSRIVDELGGKRFQRDPVYDPRDPDFHRPEPELERDFRRQFQRHMERNFAGAGGGGGVLPSRARR
jgi:hypothetical protein